MNPAPQFSSAKVKVEDEYGSPVGSEQINLSDVKIETAEISPQEPNSADSDNALVSAAVLKAEKLAAPKGLDRKLNRKATRVGGRERCGFDRDSEKLLPHHRSKLRDLLSAFIQQQKWHHASGVLAILLGIPHRTKSAAGQIAHRSDFTAAMEVLRRVDRGERNDTKVRRMFRVFSLQQHNAKLSAKGQLELALYLISTGDHEAAYNELRPLVDGKHHREDPVANLCHGLNSYYLWYKKCVEEISRHAMPPPGSRVAMEGMGESYAPDESPVRSLGDMFGHDRNQARFIEASGMDLDDMILQSSQRTIYEETDEQGLVQTAAEFWRNATILWSLDLDRQLFPIQISRDSEQKCYIVPMNDGRIRDLHAAAVKHLKQTLSLAPDIVQALLPLVQLLLAVHDIEGAVAEIDKCSERNKQHELPTRIKALLLESLERRDN